MDYAVISIGALASNALWGERGPVRTGHATTTLVRSMGKVILVDPGLPAAALAARLHERANITPEQVTDVFLTSFMPDTRRALSLFEGARWLVSEAEREAVGVGLATKVKQMLFLAEERGPQGEDQEALRAALEADINLLQRCEAAPDSLADRVDLFPLPGVTPGLCGLLLSGTRHTTLICGDAVATQEHLDDGKVLQSAVDFDRAKSSFEEAIEIADLLVLGRDNVVVNPTKRPF